MISKFNRNSHSKRAQGRQRVNYRKFARQKAGELLNKTPIAKIILNNQLYTIKINERTIV